MQLARTFRVGTRRSPLALAQTEEALAPLRRRFPHTRFDVRPIATRGDRLPNAPIASLGRGSFVKDIERALLDGDIDLAVHSAKDVGLDMPDGLRLLPVCIRQDPRDALVAASGLPLSQLPAAPRLGTGSPRRAALLRALRPDVDIRDIRGNVGSRLDKSMGADYDGVVVAAAGLARLGRLREATELFPTERFTPDVGQGILAAQFRAADADATALLSPIMDKATSVAFRAERAFLEAFGGGCASPLAAYASVHGATLRISAMAAPNAGDIIRTSAEGGVRHPDSVGRSAAQALLDAGAA